MNEIHIIAEAGTNHNGRRETAERLVDAAVESGADSVKFQIIYPEGLYVSKLYKDGRLEDNEVIAARRAGMLGDEDYRRLAEYCRRVAVPMSASVFDARGIALLDELDPPYIKIASCDLNNSYLLKKAAERGRKLIVSTGMSTLGDVERAVEDIVATGHEDIVLMHCVSVYPCPTARMNLSFIETLKTAFGFPVGLSDHTEQSLAAAAAVAMGVTWIEKHFTLDRGAPGFDHAYAMEPSGLKQYVEDVRGVSQACSRRPCKLGEAESNVRRRARRSLYAARDIAPGEKIQDDDVLVVRPEGPLRPNDLTRLVGRVARRGIQRYEPFTRNVFE
jgi:sialic acid synthase SpsE